MPVVLRTRYKTWLWRRLRNCIERTAASAANRIRRRILRYRNFPSRNLSSALEFDM
jgi:hypothetical protein